MFDSLAPKSPFDPPSLLYSLLSQPLKTLVRFTDYGLSRLQSSSPAGRPSVRTVCISDTHCLKASRIPDGDLLIHAGDLTNAGTPSELQAQIDWLDSLPHQYKVAIAGNHDTYLDPRSRKTLSPTDQDESIDWRGIHYLQHSALTLKFHNGYRHLKLYGAPQIPACGGEDFAFQYPRGQDAWSMTVPVNTEVLITHTPPKYHLDLPAALGCEHLLKEVWRTRPRAHIFGHVHAGKSDMLGRLKGGKEVVRWDKGQTSLERLLDRPGGLLRELLDPRGWMNAAKVVVVRVLSLLWDYIWVGAGARSDETIMVNAALMYNDSGQLLNKPQVIEI